MVEVVADGSHRERDARVDHYLAKARRLHGHGHLEEAGVWYEKVLSVDGDHLDALGALVTLNVQRGRFKDGLRLLNKAFAIRADNATLYQLKGLCLEGLGNNEEAVAAYRHAIGLKPRHVGAYFDLGNALKRGGYYEQAASAFKQILEFKPGSTQALIKLGNTRKQQGRLDEAIRCLEQAVLSDPRSAEAHYSLGNVLKMTGALERAVESLDRALACNPGLMSARWNRALVNLQLGRYRDAWPDYELGFALGERACPVTAKPRWTGHPMPDKTLLVVAEQGVGDTLQFMRFLPLARSRVGRVVIACQGAVETLVRDNAPVDEVISLDALPLFDSYDEYVPLLSLPGIFDTSIESLPGDGPYLRPQSGFVAKWGGRFAASQGLDVGLVWSGNVEFKDNANRSCSLRDLAPLGEVEGVRFHSLQVGPRARDVEQTRPAFSITDLAGELQCYGDTAAVIAHLDLLITVDTSAAHLAGAMGCPVWVLLQYVPDWRWGLSGEQTPWYPGARLFRQCRRGDWTCVIRQVRDELWKLTGRREDT
jgi:tetratricopeptide (TPR) repeat protein